MRKAIKSKVTNDNSLQLTLIKPKTINQNKIFKEYEQGHNMVLSGSAGTGKSFLGCYLSLKDVSAAGDERKLKIIRSSVSTRDQGFLPGTLKEKMEIYEAPYSSICADLYGKPDAYNQLKTAGKIDFESSSYQRGATFSNCIMFIDEAQNMSFHELSTLMTRVGDNCRFIVAGDLCQDDLTSERFKEQSGYEKLLTILGRISSVSIVNLTTDDIVRSGFVKEFIIQSQKV